MDRIVECVPNFSEGRDSAVWDAIGEAVSAVPGVLLLDVDPDASYNRVVVTFAGEPDAVVEAAYRATIVANERIDMRKHKGEHPRFGALDVCPFVPVRGVTMADCAEMARSYGSRVGQELGLPVYLYGGAASRPERKNLATVRAGQYEGLPDRLADPEWKPDFGPAKFVPTFGAVAAGARFFLVAYNVDLATEDVDVTQEIAEAIRQMGGKVKDASGNVVMRKGKPVRRKGKLRMVRAMGVPVNAAGRAPFCQVSINLTNYLITAPHVAFEEVRFEANKRGIEVTGSEVVGLVPVEPLLLAAEYYLFEENCRRPEMTEADLVDAACEYLGLSDYNPFDPDAKIIERRIAAAGWA